MNYLNRIKRPTILLLVAGSLCMSLNLLTRSYFEINPDVYDFFKAFGASLMFSALVVQLKLESKATDSGEKWQ